MAWTIRTLDGLDLLDPLNRPVTLPYRKVGELLAYLVTAPHRSAPRDEIASVLWPTANRETRLCNLRQALAKLRHIIGDAAIEAGRDFCGLAPAFEINYEGETHAPSESAWVIGWIQFLDRLAECAPLQMFETLRVNADLAIDLPTIELSRIIDTSRRRLPSGHDRDGWVNYWIGWCHINDVPVALGHFTNALGWAVTARDGDLIGRSAYWLGACEILQGRVHLAAKMATDAEHFLRSRGNLVAHCLASLRGTALLHAGLSQQAMNHLEGVSEETSISSAEYAQSEALRAFYLATVGRHEEALRLLQRVKTEEPLPTTSRVNVLRTMTEATCALQDSPASVISTLGPKVEEFATAGQAHFELYAHETLAIAHHKCGNRDEAEKSIANSRKKRRKLNIVYTEWDRQRLAPLRKPAQPKT